MNFNLFVVAFILFSSTFSFSVEANKLSKICNDLSNIKALITADGEHGIHNKIDATKLYDNSSLGLPRTYPISIPIHNYKTLGIDKEKKTIYYQYKGKDGFWFMSFSFVFSSCKPLKGGHILGGYSRGNNRKIYIEPDYKISIDYPSDNTGNKIVKVNIITTDDRKDYSLAIAEQKRKDKQKVEMKRMEKEKKKQEILTRSKEKENDKKEATYKPTDENNSVETKRNTGSKTVYSTMRRDSSGKGVPRRSMSIQEKNRGCRYTLDGYIQCPTKEELERKRQLQIQKAEDERRDRERRFEIDFKQVMEGLGGPGYSAVQCPSGYKYVCGDTCCNSWLCCGNSCKLPGKPCPWGAPETKALFAR